MVTCIPHSHAWMAKIKNKNKKGVFFAHFLPYKRRKEITAVSLEYSIPQPPRLINCFVLRTGMYCTSTTILKWDCWWGTRFHEVETWNGRVAFEPLYILDKWFWSLTCVSVGDLLSLPPPTSAELQRRRPMIWPTKRFWNQLTNGR